jgi:hypothetical protein
MDRDLPCLHAELLRAKAYAANPAFAQGLGWRPENSGNVLVDNDSAENAVTTVVGRVLETRLNCDAHGNYVSGRYGDLSTAKFHLLLGKPTGTPFADDFEKFIQHFEKIQENIASTQDHQNFIVPDRQAKVLRFTQRVFEERVSILAVTHVCSHVRCFADCLGFSAVQSSVPLIRRWATMTVPMKS